MDPVDAIHERTITLRRLQSEIRGEEPCEDDAAKPETLIVELRARRPRRAPRHYW